MAHEIREVAPPRFGGRAPLQRVHEADARLILAGVVALLFVGIICVNLYACFVRPIPGVGAHAVTTYGYCRDIHDFKDMMEPFASAIFTALGAAIAFYFADRAR